MLAGGLSCSALPRIASNPPCTRGCSVFTRPSIISGKPVNSETSATARPAAFSAAAVPPVETISMPCAFKGGRERYETGLVGDRKEGSTICADRPCLPRKSRSRRYHGSARQNHTAPANQCDCAARFPTGPEPAHGGAASLENYAVTSSCSACMVQRTSVSPNVVPLMNDLQGPAVARRCRQRTGFPRSRARRLGTEYPDLAIRKP